MKFDREIMPICKTQRKTGRNYVAFELEKRACISGRLERRRLGDFAAI